MVGFGIGVPVFAAGLRRALDGPAWIAAGVAGLASLGVAALPLHPDHEVPAHAVAAGIAYASLSLAPLLAAGPLARGGDRGLARFSVGAGALGAACLAATLAGPASGFFQRAGLTTLDVWLVLVARRIVRERGPE